MLHRARTRTRVIAAIAAVAVGGATFLAVNPSAGAAGATYVGGIESSPNPTTVTPGGTAPQAAGDWITTTLGAVEPSTSTDFFGIIVTLDDTVTTPGPIPILTPPTTTCKALSQAVSFASTPTITNLTTSGPGSEARFSAKLQSTSFCANAGVFDQLVIFSTVGGAAGAKLKISGIKYKVGATVGTGPIPYKVTTNAGNDAFTTANSNAIVSQVTAASTAWQTLLPPGKTSTIPAFTIKEIKAGSIPAGGVCVTLVHPPTLAKFGAAAPSVTATGGTGAGVPSAAVVSADGLSFGFTTTVSTAATTYTVRNLQLASTAPNAPARSDLGPIDVDVKAGPCATPGALLAPGVRLATVGFVERISGDNRYATAATIAIDEGTFPGKTVVIARGDNFPDALAASYLAGQNHVPILLTRATSVPVETQAALAAIGATDVIIVGGPSAITPDVENTLKSYPVYDASQSQEHPTQTNATLTVARVGGADRYETAKLVAERPGLTAGGTLGVRTDGTCSTPQATAILASGENFPDALAAGGLAFHGASGDGCGSGPIPLLLTAPGALSASTAQAMSDLKIKVVLLVGGPNAVSTNVESVITAAGLVVKRIAGDTRQDTAVMLNHDIIGNPAIGAWGSGAFLTTRSDTFPDALAASSFSGGTLSPIYLLGSGDEIGDNVQDGILGYPTRAYASFIIGGPAAVSANVETALAVLLASQPG
jgi:putative cell wall-binding protein